MTRASALGVSLLLAVGAVAVSSDGFGWDMFAALVLATGAGCGLMAIGDDE